MKCTCFFTLCIFGITVAFADQNDTLIGHLKQKGHRVGMGHCHTGKTTQPQFLKQVVLDNPEIMTIAEIGFNAGYSSELFLANSSAKVYAFDLGRFKYSKDAKEYIDNKYPDRHVFIKGNSLKTVPKYAQEHPDLKFDLIFIDGGHTYRSAVNDIQNMKAFAHEDTLVIIDDLGMKGVKKAWEESIENNIITREEVIKSGHKKWTLCKYLF